MIAYRQPWLHLGKFALLRWRMPLLICWCLHLLLLLASHLVMNASSFDLEKTASKNLHLATLVLVFGISWAMGNHVAVLPRNGICFTQPISVFRRFRVQFFFPFVFGLLLPWVICCVLSGLGLAMEGSFHGLKASAPAVSLGLFAFCLGSAGLSWPQAFWVVLLGAYALLLAWLTLSYPFTFWTYSSFWLAASLGGIVYSFMIHTTRGELSPLGQFCAVFCLTCLTGWLGLFGSRFVRSVPPPGVATWFFSAKKHDVAVRASATSIEGGPSDADVAKGSLPEARLPFPKQYLETTKGAIAASSPRQEFLAILEGSHPQPHELRAEEFFLYELPRHSILLLRDYWASREGLRRELAAMVLQRLEKNKLGGAHRNLAEALVECGDQAILRFMAKHPLSYELSMLRDAEGSQVPRFQSIGELEYIPEWGLYFVE